MTRVQTSARVAQRKQRSASARTNRQKKPLKIVLETVTQEKKRLRIVASYNEAPPAGYDFVPVGFPDLTKRCKEKCQSRDLQFQTVNTTPKNKANLDPDKVSHHIHRIGNHFPSDVVREACDHLGYWHEGHGRFRKFNAAIERRLAAHKSKEGREQIRSAIQELFPGIAAADLKDIATHAWKKGSSRVGNSDMPLARRVQLAVSAYVRHKYTNYDNLLKTVGYTNARAQVEQQTLAKLKSWRGEGSNQTETEEVFREFIVIDSDDDEGDESEDSAMSDEESDASIEFVSQATRADDPYFERQYPDESANRVYLFDSRRQRSRYLDNQERFPVDACSRTIRAPHSSVRRMNKAYYADSASVFPDTAVRGLPLTQHRRPLYAPATSQRVEPRPLQEFYSSQNQEAYRRTREPLLRAHGAKGSDEVLYVRDEIRHSPHRYHQIQPHQSHGDARLLRHRSQEHDLYDPERPLLAEPLSPDIALPSVEPAPLDQRLPNHQSREPKMRLARDQNGQTIVVPLNSDGMDRQELESHRHFIPANMPPHVFEERSRPEKRRTPQEASRFDRDRAAPSITAPTRTWVARDVELIDLSQSSPQRDGYHSQRSNTKYWEAPHTSSVADPKRVRTEPMSSPRQLGRSREALIFLDGTTEAHPLQERSGYGPLEAPRDREHRDPRALAHGRPHESHIRTVPQQHLSRVHVEAYDPRDPNLESSQTDYHTNPHPAYPAAPSRLHRIREREVVLSPAQYYGDRIQREPQFVYH